MAGQISTEWIRYFLFNEQPDTLSNFARSIGYDGDENNDYEMLEWLVNEVREYVNTPRVKGSIKFNDKHFFSSLKNQVEHDQEYYKRMYNEQINNGYFLELTGETDKLSKDIRNKIIESYNDTLNSDFNERKQGLFLTKDKNLYIEKYEILKDKLVGLEEVQTNITNKLKEDLNSDQIQIEIEPNDTLLNLKLRGLIDIIENQQRTGSINDKYVYSFFIGDTWKSFPLKSNEEWNKLLNMLKNGSLIFNMDNLEQLYWSDGFYNMADQVLPDLSVIRAIRLKKVKDVHVRGDNSSAFFRYTIKDYYKQLEPLLSTAQIFNTINEGNKHRKELNYNCFCYALKMAAEFSSLMDKPNLRIPYVEWESTFNEICKDCIGRTVSIKEVKDLVIKYNLYVNLTTFSDKDQKRNRKSNQFGDKDKAIITCNLGIFKQESNYNHFFYNYKVPTSRYFSEHVTKIIQYSYDHNKQIEWSYKVTGCEKGCYKINKTKFKPIEMIDLVYNLFKSNVFKPLTYNDTVDLDSDIHHYINPSIESLLGNVSNIKNIKYKTEGPRSKIKQSKRSKTPKEIDENTQPSAQTTSNSIVTQFFYADFEADPTSNVHTPYCCSICERGSNNITSFYGLDCVEKLLQFLPNNSTTYFHNFGYDGRFIAKYGVRNAINKGSKIMNMKVNYKNPRPTVQGEANETKSKILNFKDSYTMIAMPLKRFPMMFKNVIDNKTIQKELFPYNYYTIDNVLSNVGTISEAGKNETPKWNEDQYKTFNNNIDKINNCRIDNNHFNMEIYCKFYCEQDVRILSLGHTEFRRLTLQEPIELDIDNYISAPSLSNAFFTKNVYSLIPELKQYSGVYREFIQKGVYGGRCMTNSNKKYHVTDELSDFDACSLYPSAMGRLYLPTGAPQVITAEMMDKDYLVNHVLPERELMPSINKPITAFFVEIEITHVGKHLNFPLICKRTKQGNSNVNECCTMFVDNYVLEDLIKYQQIEYKVIRGYYWTGPKSPLLSKVIREIYDLRVQYKREGNPLQEVLKLIMNSAYGKTIQKAIENDFEYKSNYKNRNGNSKAEKYLSKNFHKIEEIFDIGNNITAFKTKKGIDKHYVPNFIGVQILSMSKRIMNEVMCTAEDLKIPIYYQDTDSMHIKVDSLNLLSEEFKKRYNRELIGSNMGQFHSDFDHKDGGKNIVSIESYFLGKKAYCDKLINENKQIDYHLRMKGIPNECLKMYSKDFNDEPLELYKYLFEDNYINFNILDVKPSFEMKNDMTIRSRQKFSRKIKF